VIDGDRIARIDAFTDPRLLARFAALERNATPDRSAG
jgi:hypothetical protein